MDCQTTNLDAKRRQRTILEKQYPDYDPKYHDAFVIRFNKEHDTKNLLDYMAARGIK